MNSCGAGASPCHGTNPAGQGLDFGALVESGTLWQAMAGVPSCQYDAMPLVSPGDPDQSWLMVKLTAPTGPEGRLDFAPALDWEPMPGSCAVAVAGRYDFGTRMPEIGSLSDDEIETIRAWIIAGAAQSDR